MAPFVFSTILCITYFLQATKTSARAQYNDSFLDFSQFEFWKFRCNFLRLHMGLDCGIIINHKIFWGYNTVFFLEEQFPLNRYKSNKRKNNEGTLQADN